MEIDPQRLPNDPAALQRVVASLLETQEQRLRQMQHWLEELLRQRYGHKSERLDEDQLFLFAVEMAGTGQPVPLEPQSAAPKPKPEGPVDRVPIDGTTVANSCSTGRPCSRSSQSPLHVSKTM